LYGIIAGTAANAIVYAGVVSFGSKLANQPEFSATYVHFTQGSTMASILLGGILAGVVVGMISSMLAMEKYLKLKKW
jgi:hypothetical protein